MRLLMWFSNTVKKCNFPSPFTSRKKSWLDANCPIWKVHKIAVKTVKREYSYSCFALMRNSSILTTMKERRRHSKTFFFIMTNGKKKAEKKVFFQRGFIAETKVFYVKLQFWLQSTKLDPFWNFLVVTNGTGEIFEIGYHLACGQKRSKNA